MSYSWGSIAALLLSFHTTSSHAFWRMNCATIQQGRIDPLVAPGAIASHSHSIVGGSNIGIGATTNSLLNSACTSCEITADKSAYWTPSLYYQYPNNTFYEVPHSGSVVYYLGRGPNAAQSVPFPKGLSMISGDKSARSYDNSTYTWGNATYPARRVADRVSFNCLADSPLAEQPYMFRTDCPNGLRAQIQFQSCWNGKDLYTSDNSHVAYQTQIDNGVCPPTHPYQIPHLFMETLWSVANVPNQATGGRFVFSQGDPTGYGFHADFMNGWDQDVLANATANCLATDNAGQISACPVLQAVQTNGYPQNCPERPSQISEAVSGYLTKLPGCITITEGPGPAPAASMTCPSGVALPAVASTVDSVSRATATVQPGQSFGLSNKQIYMGCYNDSAAGSVRTLNSASTSQSSLMSVEYCQNYCNTKGYRLSGVEYGQECFCDNALNPTAQNGTQACTFTCSGNMTTGGTQEICGGLGYISVYNNTDPSFSANGDNSHSAGKVSAPTTLSALPANYVGCTTDNQANTRALSGISADQVNMSAEVCAAYCSKYQFYGLEYGTQCFCGNSIMAPNTNTSASACNMRCSGAGNETCGGPNALSLYNNTAYVAPKIKTPVGKYVQNGCLTDPNTSGRSLTGASTSSSSMTAEVCVAFCSGKGMHYAGVEYGAECYCGNSISSTSGGKTTTCAVGSLMTCAGDALEFCGGPNLMNLYYAATL